MTSNQLVIDHHTGEVLSDGDIESQDWYVYLVEECKAIITEAVFNSRWALVEGYHQLGERIVTDENYQKASKGNYSSLQRVAKNLDISDRTLYYAIQFYEKCPDLNMLPFGKNVSWRKIVNEYLPSPKTDPDDEEQVSDDGEILRAKWGVEHGQLWLLGRHRLLCGDIYNKGEHDRLIGEHQVNALITDPPYGIDYKPEWEKWDSSPSDFRSVIGDDREFDPRPFLHYPIVVLFGANYFSDKLPVGGWICWDKRLDEKKDSMFGSPFELAWFRSVNTTRNAIMVRVLHGGVVNADSRNGNNEKRLHATQKPVAVMEAILDELTGPMDVILDPFSGSGSTILAGNRDDRVCLAMEIDPRYVAVTLERWQAETGIVPIKEEV